METKGKKGKHAKGKKGKDKGKGKHQGKDGSSPKFLGYCGHSGKWGHKRKDCRYKNTVAEVDEEECVEPPNSRASSSTTRATPPPPGLSSAGAAQSTAGTISTLMEDHAQSGCELVVGSDGVRMRECECVELLVDTGATEHVCGPHDFTHAALKNGPRPALKLSNAKNCEWAWLLVSLRWRSSLHLIVTLEGSMLCRFDCALVNQGVNDASLQVHTCSSCSMMLSDCERILISFL